MSKRRTREQIHRLPYVKESVLLTTCNRIEAYFATSDSDSTNQAFFKLVGRFAGAERRFFYEHRDIDAITHLFSLSSGLDSMVLGEEQIIEQVKETGINERVSGHSKAVLSALFDASYGAGRRIRSRSTGRVDASVSAFALKLALKKLGRQPRRTLLIGTGKTVRLAAKELEASEIYVVTARDSLPPALEDVKIIRRDEIKMLANDCDLIISATKHPGYLLGKSDLSGDKKRVILDLAFPRNVDPALREIRSTFLYDLDVLAKEATKFSTSLQRATAEARRHVLKEAEDFQLWLLASRLSAHLSSLYRWAENVRREELETALNRLPGLSERERHVVAALSKRLVSKILVKPTQFAKTSSENITQQEKLRLVEKVFMLEEERNDAE